MGQVRTGRVVRTVALLACLCLVLTACDTAEVLDLLNARLVEPDPVAAAGPSAGSATTGRAAGAAADGRTGGDQTGGSRGTTPDATPRAAADADDRPAPSAAATGIEREIHDLLNAARRQAGVATLTRRGGMSDGAREWSCDMARTGDFRHANLRAVGVDGENIAWGQRSAAEVHQDWMNSPGHRENRMNERWTEYGVGVCESSSGQQHYTERFR